MPNRSVIWLRRDLRLDDSFVFSELSKINSSSYIIFIFDQLILKHFSKKDDRRISFLYDRLQHLNQELKKKSSELNIFFGDPKIIMPQILDETRANRLIAARGYEEYDISRDKKIEDICAERGVNFILGNDHLIHPPEESVKEDGSVYQVYTPFSKRTYKKILDRNIQKFDQNTWFENISIADNKWQLRFEDGKEKNLEKMGYEITSYKPWNIEFSNNDIENFAGKISDYKEKRDFLSVDATSKFSPYLRFGFISIRSCLEFAMQKRNSFGWVNELLWREFYAVALFYHPQIAYEEFNKKYRGMSWNTSKDLEDKFRNCETGYPIIDASMKQLYQEGWMHNRSRMIVASFFTKHLFMDWRIGEKIFSEYLMDYELSSNAGGWQWAASTGFDAQPYFRVFNPYLQSKKFDPEGKYIKKYLPCLKNIDCSKIHEAPYLYTAYPLPIVKHEEARKKAIEKFKTPSFCNF